MFLKARQWLRMILLGLAVHIGNLTKFGIRKEYDQKSEHRRHQGIKQRENNFQPGPKSNLNGPSRSTVDDPTKYKLGLTGKLEPQSHLPTIDLLGNTHLEHSSRCYCSLCPWCSVL